MHALRHPRPVSATVVTPDDGGRDVVEETGAGGTEAMTEARRVVEPDLLWIESVTERLLGSAGRPAAWERVYFEGGEPTTSPVHDERTEEEPAGENPAAALRDDPLPQRTPRDFDGPVSYRQPAAYVGPATVDPLTTPPPVAEPGETAENEPESQPPSERQEPLVSAEPSPLDLDLAPVEPHLTQVRPPSPAAAAEPTETSRGEDMPPAVLRAALRDALPDVFSVRPAAGPADAVFGDPRWSLPAEEDDEPAQDDAVDEAADEIDEGPEAGPELAGEDAERLRAATAAAVAEPGAEDDRPSADEPVQSPYFEPVPDHPHAPPSYADLGYGFPRPPDQLSVADVALRLAFRSADRELSEAVVRLVARQARERSRLQIAEAYLDALLDEGDAALPSAARLRRILSD